eukprot:3778197-Amphidinium_carterae.1
MKHLCAALQPSMQSLCHSFPSHCLTAGCAAALQPKDNYCPQSNESATASTYCNPLPCKAFAIIDLLT